MSAQVPKASEKKSRCFQNSLRDIKVKMRGTLPAGRSSPGVFHRQHCNSHDLSLVNLKVLGTD